MKIKVRFKKEYLNLSAGLYYSLPTTLRELLMQENDGLTKNNQVYNMILEAEIGDYSSLPFNKHSTCKIADFNEIPRHYSTKYFEEVKNETSTTKSTFNNYDKVAAYLLKDANSNLDAFDEQELGLNESDLYEIEDLAQDRWNEIRNAEELTFSFTLTRYEWEKLSASDPEFNKRIQEKLSNRGNH